jgi:hypothetical protein
MTFLFEVVVGAPLDHGVNEDLTREERWNIIWAAPWRRWRLNRNRDLMVFRIPLYRRF